MKKTGLALVVLTLVFFFEAVAFGRGKINFGVYSGFGANALAKTSLNLGVRINFPKGCPLGLEATLLVPYGFEVAAPLYLFSSERFKFHVILPFMGIEFPFSDFQISVDWLAKGRPWNLVVGGGFEILVSRNLFGNKKRWSRMSLNLDWRAFVPNPFRVTNDFMDYGAVIYRRSAVEGFVWTGLTFWL